MSDDPAYVRRLLDQAREEGQWYAGQPDAAAHCFEVLALLPNHREAAELIYELFCDEWLIYDNRNAIQQQIDDRMPRNSKGRIPTRYFPGNFARTISNLHRQQNDSQIIFLIQEALE